MNERHILNLNRFHMDFELAVADVIGHRPTLRPSLLRAHPARARPSLRLALPPSPWPYFSRSVIVLYSLRHILFLKHHFTPFLIPLYRIPHVILCVVPPPSPLRRQSGLLRLADAQSPVFPYRDEFNRDLRVSQHLRQLRARLLGDA